MVVAFDGSPGARKALARLAQHPLVVGLPVLVAMVALDTPLARQQLKEAQAALQAAASTPRSNWQPVSRNRCCLNSSSARRQPCSSMGAFGHSRLRQILVGSTTTRLLRFSDVPVLILR